jgi:TolA-binding protein
MRAARTAPVFAFLVAACAGSPDRHTLAELHDRAPDMAEVEVEHGLDQAMVGYRKYLEEAPESSLTPEAMRRLADLKLEKEYGILGEGVIEIPAPETPPVTEAERGAKPKRPQAAGIADHSESEADFERRAAGAAKIVEKTKPAAAGPLEAIALYDQILKTYPNYPQNDQVLYQKSRALDELGRIEEAIAVMERLIAEYPGSRHIDEVQFRRAEYFFTRRKYRAAEEAYSAITRMGAVSEYYELAMYKLGWTFYKQDFHEEALDAYMALLDYKVTTGYDFDQSEDEDAERRIADTFRVISLSFSNLGGQEVLADYFEKTGHRGYEDRIYSHLGEFYLEKLRYADAAKAYQAFVTLYPLHKASPHFSMRVVEIYEKGDFPKLVLEAKKEFAASYGLQSEYWQHFAVADSPDVVGYLKTNLKDLAGHYHGLYQNADLKDDKPANFEEASRWYRGYLASFPQDAETPGIHHKLADLLLEHEDFGEAAREYERVAYEYPEHERAAAAGYAAIYAHRQQQKRVSGDEQAVARRVAVDSTLRFVDRFPQHEQAPAVLGAAADDLYEMKEFAPAISAGQKLIDTYPQADAPIRRDAWTVIAHSSIETGDYPKAEIAYARVLEMTPESDESRQSVVDNLAAAIYKQGEQAKLAQDHRAAADHFLRIKQAAPSSKVRPLAEYDAGAELIQLKDYAGATAVLDSFRQAHPDHELNREATKQLALVYREEGNAVAAAGEYQRVAAEAEDPALRREALLQAGELYASAKASDRALAVYLEYVDRFPEPVESAVETRFKVAELYQAKQDQAGYRDQLGKIVESDARAGDQRTARVRYLAARSALVLTEDLYRAFAAVKLVQPFERSLQEKKRRMEAALDGYGRLVDYEVGEVTAGATWYMAEIYSDFSRAINESERPSNLDSAEQQEYETALEEEAFPFEEKAIEIHRKNLELLASGIYNPWIEKSLARLAELMPGRYAKFEASSGLVTSIDRYAYLAPIPRSAPALEAAADAPPAEPAATEPAVVEEEAPPPPAAPASDLGVSAAGAQEASDALAP